MAVTFIIFHPIEKNINIFANRKLRDDLYMYLLLIIGFVRKGTQRK